MKNLIEQNPAIDIVKEDSENLQMELSLTYSNMKVKIGALYGDDITSRLFRKNLPVSDLLLLRYDDIWLSQLITINETELEKIINYLLDKYSTDFESRLLPDGKDREGYLADIIQFLCACEA